MTYASHLASHRATLKILADFSVDIGIDLRHLPYAGEVYDKTEEGRYDVRNRGVQGGGTYWEGAPGRTPRGALGQWYTAPALTLHRPEGVVAWMDVATVDSGLMPKTDYTPAIQAGGSWPPPGISITGEDQHRYILNLFGHALPNGTSGILMQGSTLDNWNQWVAPIMELVAHHYGNTGQAGPPNCSTTVSDLTIDGFVDKANAAGLHSHLRVVGLHTNEFQAAWNLTKSTGDQTGWGALIGKGDGGDARRTFAAGASSDDTIGLTSWEKGGVFHPGHTTSDQHSLGRNGAGQYINPTHIWDKALIYRNVIEDGPIRWTEYFPAAETSGMIKRVWAGFNRDVGMWDFWHVSKLIDPPEPDYPWTEENDLFPWGQGQGQGGPGGGRGGGGRGNRVGNPSWYEDDRSGNAQRKQKGGKGRVDREVEEENHIGTRRKGNPTLLEGELACFSLIVMGSPHKDSQPGNGAYGGGESDTEGVVDATGESVDILDYDVSVDIFEPGRTDQSLLDEATARELEGIESDQFRNEIERQLNEGSTRSDGGSVEGSGEADPDLVIDEYTGTPAAGKINSYIQGRRGALTNSAKRRGGPTPLSAHIWGLPKVGNGHWQYKSDPGDVWGNGTAEAAAMMIGPMALSDGKADQSDWLGDLCVLLYNGEFGGNPVECFGWGQYDQTTGTWADGAVDSLTGSSGSFNTQREYRDASGVQRLGTHTLQGELFVDINGGGGTGSGIEIKDSGSANQSLIEATGVGKTLRVEASPVPHTASRQLGNTSLRWASVWADLFRAGDGAVGAPSLAFADDTDTGLYRVGASQIGWSCGGTARMGLTTASLKPLGNATDLGAVSDPWGCIYADCVELTSGVTVGKQTFTDPDPSVDIVSDTGGKYIIVTTTGGGTTMKMPASPTTGREFVIKNHPDSTNAVSLDPNGKEIDGSTSTRTLAVEASLTLYYDGTEWYIV